MTRTPQRFSDAAGERDDPGLDEAVLWELDRDPHADSLARKISRPQLRACIAGRKCVVMWTALITLRS